MGELLLDLDELGRMDEVLMNRATSVNPILRRHILLQKLDDAWSEFLIRAEEIDLSMSLGTPSIFEPLSELVKELEHHFEELIGWAKEEFIKEISVRSMPPFKEAIFKRTEDLGENLVRLVFNSAPGPSRSPRRP